MTHIIKCWPEFFEPLSSGIKKFEIRKNDRDYKVGDILDIREWNPHTHMSTGRRTLKKIIYMIQGQFGLPEDVCVIQLN